MAKERQLTCIICPRGCQLNVKITDEGKFEISGNACKRGEEYAVSECTNPQRTVTSTVRVKGGGVVSVKTDDKIPKDMIFPLMEKINTLVADNDVKVGDVIEPDVLGLGVNVVATSNVR